MCYAPDPIWFRLLLVVVPVIAAFVGVVLTNRNNRNIQDARIAAEKAEKAVTAKRSAALEIFALMEAWSADMRISGVVLADAIGRGIPVPDDHHRILMDTSRYLHARMLLAVHFSHLEPQLVVVLAEQDKILTAGMNSATDGRTPAQRKSDAHDATGKLGTKTLALLDSITVGLKTIH